MSYFDDNEDYLVNKRYHGRVNMMENELVKFKLISIPESKHTSGGKLLTKVECMNIDNDDEEVISVVAWEDDAEVLADLSENDEMIVKGYRKFNDFLKKEEFIIKQFIKRERGE